MFRRDQKQRQLTFADLSNAAQAVPQDHILIRMRESVRWEFVEQELKASYADGPVGRPGWSPAKLVRMLLLQEYADLSGRDLEEQVGYNLLYRAFVGLSAEDSVPDATTMVRFRTRIGTEGMRRVFAEVNRQWEAAGLIGAERRAVDGVHLWARVVRRSWAQLVGYLRGELVAAVLRQEGPARAEELQRCATLTAPERELRSEERVKAEIARTEQLLQATASVQGVEVVQARERLQQVLQNVGQVSLVDPDARWGHKKEDQPFLGYKAHQAMDPESRLITAVDVVPGNQNEAVQMTALLVQETTTLGPETVVIGDGLYDNATTRKQVEEHPAQLCAAGRRAARVSDQFQYDPVTNTLVCPAGKRSQSQTIQDQGTLYRFSQKDCGPCPLRNQCLTRGEQDPKGKPRRRVYLSDAHKAKLVAGTAGKAWRHKMLALRRRIEPKFDEQVNQHGLRRLRCWGRLKAAFQVLTNAVMVNLKRAAKLLGPPPPIKKSPQGTPCPA